MGDKEEEKDVKNEELKKDSKETNENDTKKEIEKVESNKAESKEDTEKSETKKDEKKPEEKTNYAYEVKAENEKKEKAKSNDSNVKIKNKKALIAIIVAVVVIVIAIIVYFVAFHKKTIDLSKYIELDYEGYDGYATVYVEIDDELKDYLGSKSLYNKFVDKVEFDIENDENLSNGDQIEVKVSISSSWLKNNKLRLKNDTITFTVEGLEEAEVLDLFDEADFEIEITGISPDLSASVNNNSKNSFIKNYVSYYLDNYYDLANGDTIVITAYYDEYEADDEGIVIAKDTMEYTIEGEPEYVDEIEDLTDTILSKIEVGMLAEVKEEIESDGNTVITYNYDETDYSEEFTSSEPELVAEYLLTKKGTSYWSSENIVYGIYKVVYTSTTTGATYEWYFVGSVSDVAIQDGTLYEEDDLDYDSSDKWDDGKTQQKIYNDVIDSNKSYYVIETIK